MAKVFSVQLDFWGGGAYPREKIVPKWQKFSVEADEMEIRRDQYLKQLVDYQWDGQVKVITGIRRCGKSYLLRTLFKN